MATTYNNLYLDLRRALKGADIPSAQLEARELVCFAAAKSREEFFRDLPLYVPEQVEERAREMTRRRVAGEPVAYILGEWEFYGLTLEVSPDVLIPRMDTEVLAEQAILRAREVGEGCRVLDLCAGSGCVGLAVAANVPPCRVMLADCSEPALELCKRNIRRCGLTNQVGSMQTDALQPPPLSLLNYDIITCNPPYIRTDEMPGLDRSVRDYEPHLALEGGFDGLNFYRAISREWKKALRPGGMLLFEVGAGQASAVEQLMVLHGFDQVKSISDTQEIRRVVTGVLPD